VHHALRDAVDDGSIPYVLEYRLWKKMQNIVSHIQLRVVVHHDLDDYKEPVSQPGPALNPAPSGRRPGIATLAILRGSSAENCMIAIARVSPTHILYFTVRSLAQATIQSSPAPDYVSASLCA
jgi:hypothetical protein